MDFICSHRQFNKLILPFNAEFYCCATATRSTTEAASKKKTVKNTGANKSGLDRAGVSVQYILVRVYPGGLRLSGSSRLS